MIDEAFQGRLLPGENIVWSGRPGQGLVFMARDTFLIPFSLVWCGFAIFWTVGATSAGAPTFFTFWGLMFVCVGLYFVVGRFLLDAWVRRDMRYAVTDQRILISRSAPLSRFTAIDLARLPDVDLAERKNGSGTVRFGPAISMLGTRSMTGWSPSLDPTPQFIAIEGARRVFDLVQRTRQIAR